MVGCDEEPDMTHVPRGPPSELPHSPARGGVRVNTQRTRLETFTASLIVQAPLAGPLLEWEGRLLQ